MRPRTSYLGPLGVDEASLDGVVQSGAVLTQPQVRRRAVAVQDAVLWVGAERFRVEAHGQLELPLLAGLVTATHPLQELGFAQDSRSRTGRPVRPPTGGDHGRGGGWRGRRDGGPAGGARAEEGELRRRSGRGKDRRDVNERKKSTKYLLFHRKTFVILRQKVEVKQDFKFYDFHI